MRKSNEPNKMISMTIIAELVLLTLTLISRSACAFCFCQPSEPFALQSVIRERGRKMNKLNSIVLKFSSSLAALALLVGVSSAASACYFWFNQPKMPKAIEKFRKNI